VTHSGVHGSGSYVITEFGRAVIAAVQEPAGGPLWASEEEVRARWLRELEDAWEAWASSTAGEER
jgi:hypothetical protein